MTNRLVMQQVKPRNCRNFELSNNKPQGWEKIQTQLVMTNIQVNKIMKEYSFNYNGISDTHKLFYSCKNGIDQKHLITFDKSKSVITHKILNDNDEVYVDNKYTTIDKLVDYLNNCSGGIIF